MRSFVRIAVSLVAVCSLAGCATQLRMKPVIEPRDESVVSPELAAKKYRRVMVIPPSGTQRGGFDRQISLFEREFLKSNVKVIAGAITGRVVLESQRDGSERRVEGAAQLSDAERALIMAKQTGADAILQIGEFTWTANPQPTRYFVLEGDNYKETTQPAYAAVEPDKRVSFNSQALTFIGRLMDVQTGEIMASFQITSAANHALPEEYVAEIKRKKGVVLAENENFKYSKSEWVQEARERIESKVIQATAKRIVGP